ncbi:MAG: DUF2809 domain-containing protein [Myxococcota bacterium]
MRPNLGAAAVAASSAAAVGVLFVAARGPLRSFFGDVVIVVFLVAALATVRLGGARARLAGVAVVSVGAELVQGLGWVGPGSHWLLHLTLGSTADPLDLVAYALGLVAAAGFERAWAGR